MLFICYPEMVFGFCKLYLINHIHTNLSMIILSMVICPLYSCTKIEFTISLMGIKIVLVKGNIIKEYLSYRHTV